MKFSSYLLQQAALKHTQKSTQPKKSEQDILTFVARSQLPELSENTYWKAWETHPGPQTIARYSPADVLGYGGQAGGGKSALQLITASCDHTHAIIFRRQYQPSLTGLIKDSHKLLNGSGAKFNSQAKEWRGIPGDRVLQFGYMKSDGDQENWRGIPHDFKGIDEATEFTYSQFLFLTGWLRSAKEGQRCRIVLTFNPPSTIEGRWVVDYFAPWIDPEYTNRTGKPSAAPGELRWFVGQGGKDLEIDTPTEYWYGDRLYDSPMAVNEKGERIYPRPKPIERVDPKTGRSEWLEPKSRTFIHASLDDNPSLRDTGYRGQLQLLPEPLRSQLLYGDFGARTDDDAWQVIPRTWLDQANENWRQYRDKGILNAQALTHLGCDVAQGGGDSSVIAIRRHLVIEELSVKEGRETPDGESYLDFVIAVLRDRHLLKEEDYSDWHTLSKKFIHIDGTPSGAYQILKSKQYKESLLLRKNKFTIIPMTGSAAAVDNDEIPIIDKSDRLIFKNRRTLWAWNLRELLDPKSGNTVAIPPDPKLTEELLSLRYKTTDRKVEVDKGLYQWERERYEIALEPKKDLVKRLGRSPDRADAVCMAFAPTASRAGIF